jgi:ParB/RepB/Spo0J family partition protein
MEKSKVKVIQINLDQIEQNENSRVDYKEHDLAELMGSLKQDGLLQAIGVRSVKGGRYECIFGNRRLIAAKRLGWATIAARVIKIEDDIGRDVINLIENSKRKQTTVIEDARIFQSLMDRGLSQSEVAARLGISKTRIETAISALAIVPKEFQAKVVFAPLAGPSKKGLISASTMKMIAGLHRTHQLSADQVRTLLQFASRDGVSEQHIRQIAPLIRTGKSIEDAVRMINKFKVVRVAVMMEHATIARIENLCGMPISQVLADHLSAHKPFKILKSERSGKRAKETHGVAALAAN